jgi:hypothetical protein
LAFPENPGASAKKYYPSQAKEVRAKYHYLIHLQDLIQSSLPVNDMTSGKKTRA